MGSSDSSRLSVSSDGSLVASTVPREILTDPKELPGASDANSYQLSRGQFRLTFRVPEPEPDIDIEARATSYIKHVQDSLQYAQTDDGPKRIYVYSISQEPTDPVDGEEALLITATFAVLDNPVWIVPALYALTAAIGTVGGWFLIDKVESFSGTTAGSIVVVTAAALTAFLLYKNL